MLLLLTPSILYFVFCVLCVCYFYWCARHTVTSPLPSSLIYFMRAHTPRPAILPGYRRVFSLVSAREDAKLGLRFASLASKNEKIAVVSGTPDPFCTGIMG